MSADPVQDLQPLIITVDGPAGTGKSTVAHMLAERLGLEYLDTGAMYRAAAVVALDSGIDPSDGPCLAAAVEDTGIRFDWSHKPPALRLGSRDVSRRIRDMDVSGIVSIVAAQPEVRRALVREQRSIAADHPRLVSEGRDQGSVVFPAAPFRFYLDADEAVRAERRLKQLREAGAAVEEAAVARDIRERDRIDSSRADAPLVCPEGAIVIDTSGITAREVVEGMMAVILQRMPDAAGSAREGGRP